MPAKDEDRFRSLAAEHAPAVAAYLRHRIYPLAPSELDDLIEETLIVLWRRIDDCPLGSERAWLIGVARNILNNARRSSTRRAALARAIRPAEPAPSPELVVLAASGIRDALSILSPRDREVLVLHYWDGLTTAEIALALELSHKAAESRLHRAQIRLREATADGERRNARAAGK